MITKRRCHRVAIAALMVSYVVGCATSTEVIQLYRAPLPDGQSYERILVVNVTPDQQRQIDFETAIVRQFAHENVVTIAAHDALGSTERLQQADLDRVSAEVLADAILIAHVVSLDVTVEVDEGRTDVISQCRGGNPLDYFLYDRVTISEPDSVRFAHTVTVVSNLYDARTRERLWTIQSTCFQKATLSEAMHDEAIAIVRQLKTDGLI